MQMVTREIKKKGKVKYVQELEEVYVDEGYVIDTFDSYGYQQQTIDLNYDLPALYEAESLLVLILIMMIPRESIYRLLTNYSYLKIWDSILLKIQKI